MLIGHSCVLREMSFQFLCPFLNGGVSVVLGVLYISWILMLTSHMICNLFLPFCGLPFPLLTVSPAVQTLCAPLHFALVGSWQKWWSCSCGFMLRAVFWELPLGQTSMSNVYRVDSVLVSLRPCGVTPTSLVPQMEVFCLNSDCVFTPIVEAWRVLCSAVSRLQCP